MSQPDWLLELKGHDLESARVQHEAGVFGVTVFEAEHVMVVGKHLSHF